MLYSETTLPTSYKIDEKPYKLYLSQCDVFINTCLQRQNIAYKNLQLG